MAAPKSLRGIRGAVVDDDPDGLEMLTFILEAEGAEVAASLIPSPRSHSADVLVTDLYMPKMTGWDLVGAVRELVSQP